MANVQEAVERLTIEVVQKGVAEGTAGLGRYTNTQREAITVSDQYGAALQRQQRRINEAQAANENFFSDKSGPGLTVFMRESAAGAEASGAALIRWGRVIVAVGGLAAVGGTAYAAMTGQIGALGDMAKLGGEKIGTFATWLKTLDSTTVIAAGAVATLAAAYLVYNSQSEQAANDNERLGKSFASVAGGVESSIPKMLLFGGALGVVTAGLALLSKATDDLIKLGDRAQDSRIGTTTLMALEQAAIAARVPLTDLNSAIENFTKVSKKAPDDAKEFYRALSNIDAGLSAAFRSAPTQEARLKIIADGLAKAKGEVQRYQLAQEAFAVSNDRFISVFSGGGSAIDAYIEKAKALGITIDDAFIDKAAEAQSQMATLTNLIAQYLTIKAVEAAQAVKDMGAAFVGAGVASQNLGDTIMGWLPTVQSGMTSFRSILADIAYDLGLLASAWAALKGIMSSEVSSLSDLSRVGKPLAEVLGINETAEQALNREMARMGKEAANEFYNGLAGGGSTEAVAAVTKLIVNATPPAFKAQPSLKEANETRDALDRQADAIKRRTATMIADTAAVGMGVRAQEEYRAKAQLLEAQVRADIETVKISTLSKAEQAKAIDKIAEAAGRAHEALALARAQNQADFTTKTMFLSPEDLAVAQAMNQIWGNEWPQHTQDNLALQIKFNAQMAQTKDLLGTAFSGIVNDLTKGVSLMDALANAAGRLGQALIDIGSKQIFGQLMGALSGGGALTAYGGGGAGDQGPVQGGGLASAGLGASLGSLGAYAGPLALVAGIGLSMFQAHQQAKKAQEQAVAAWRGMSHEFSGFIDEMAGKFRGNLARAIDQAAASMLQFVNAAAAARDWAAVARAQNAYNDFQVRKAFEFLGIGGTRAAPTSGPVAFEANIAALGSGNQGSLQAQQQMQSTLDMVRGFIDDVAQSFAIVGGGIGVAAAVAQATEASKKYLLSLADIPPTLSQTASSIQKMTDQAAALSIALQQLGMSAAEATAEVNAHTAASITALLQRDINAASGNSWLNDLEDLKNSFNAIDASAKALGVSSQLVNDWLAAQAQALINSAQLTGASLQTLLNAFPQLSGAVHEFSEALIRSAQDIERERQSLLTRLFNATNDASTLEGQLAAFDRSAALEKATTSIENLALLEEVQAAERYNIIKSWNDKIIEDTKRAAEEAKNFLEGALKNIKTYLDNMTAGSGSPLSPSARLAEAQSQYNTQLALAQGGDRDALSSITQYASNLQEAAKAYYASSDQYQAIFAQIQATLGALPDQLSAEQFIVNGITDALASMQAVLAEAIATGSAANIAAALLPMFNSLDANVDGLLDLTEFTAGLHGMASDAALATMFKTLDTDNSGSLTKLELANTIAGGTKSNTDALTDSSSTGIPNSIAQTALNMVSARGYLEQIPPRLEAQGSTLADHAVAARQGINAMNANRVIPDPGTLSPLPIYHTGGLVGANDNDVLALLQRGEFVMQRSAVQSIGVPELRQANQTGRFGGADNSAVVAELRRLYDRIGQLEQRLVEAEYRGADTVTNSVEGLRADDKRASADRQHKASRPAAYGSRAA